MKKGDLSAAVKRIPFVIRKKVRHGAMIEPNGRPANDLAPVEQSAGVRHDEFPNTMTPEKGTREEGGKQQIVVGTGRSGKAEEEFEKMGMPVKLMSTKEAVELQLGAIDALTKEQNGLILSPTAKVSVPALAPKSE